MDRDREQKERNSPINLNKTMVCGQVGGGARVGPTPVPASSEDSQQRALRLRCAHALGSSLSPDVGWPSVARSGWAQRVLARAASVILGRASRPDWRDRGAPRLKPRLIPVQPSKRERERMRSWLSGHFARAVFERILRAKGSPLASEPATQLGDGSADQKAPPGTSGEPTAPGPDLAKDAGGVRIQGQEET
jgi:hypothetical protein